jgi:hypothetical protein
MTSCSLSLLLAVHSINATNQFLYVAQILVNAGSLCSRSKYKDDDDDSDDYNGDNNDDGSLIILIIIIIIITFLLRFVCTTVCLSFIGFYCI